jgi:hypothetical protein
VTNGPYLDSNTKQQFSRTVNVQYQFTYDNTEYQNPQLLPDNNALNIPGQGFKYLPNSSIIPFGDLYMSLYTWYASATRDLYTYLNNINTELNTISNSTYYNPIITIYNNQTSNLSTYTGYQALYTSTNIIIQSNFSMLMPKLTASAPWEQKSFPFSVSGHTYYGINITGPGEGGLIQYLSNCDNIHFMPPKLNDDLISVTYNYRPGDSTSNTAYSNGSSNLIYNKYRTIPLSYFISTVVLGPSIDLNGTSATTNTTLSGFNVNENLYQEPPSSNNYLDHSVGILNPADYFYAETDRCKYQYTNDSLQYFSNIMSNIGLRDSLYNNMLTLQSQINTNTVQVSTIMSNEITWAFTNNVIQTAGQTLTQLYPVISNINDRVTFLSQEQTATTSNITDLTTQYTTLLTKQQSDINLPVYMANRVIPIVKRSVFTEKLKEKVIKNIVKEVHVHRN